MVKPDKLLEAVSHVTQLPESEIVSPSRMWPLVQARMLFVLYASRNGCRDSFSTSPLHRARPTIFAIRRSARNYIAMSVSFQERYNQVAEYYESCAQSV